MSKSKKTKKNLSSTKGDNKTPKTSTPKTSPLLDAKWHKILIFALAFGLYANTLGHGYAQDDAIVIYDNMFTQEGLSGFPGILSKDTFYGFFKEEGKANLVAGGRYRPFTQLMFALEWQLFGKSPFVGHLINVLLYGLLGIVLYNLLQLLLRGPNRQGQKERGLSMLILLTTLFFIAHPIHTEAVANIKGRDEIMTMMGALLAFWTSLKYYHTKHKKWLLLTILWFFMGLMSKENAITFLAVIPLGYLLFKRQAIAKSLSHLVPFALSTVAFLAIRFSVLGADFGSKSMELMNNPFIKWTGTTWVPFSGGEKMATILFSLGKYIGLMIFPHPLSHDYYPRAVEIMQMGNWQVIGSLLLHLAMLSAAFYFWKKDKVITFGLLYYFITLSIVSNIVFPIGTCMSERFLFMPSLGLLLVVARLMTKHIHNTKAIWGLGGLLLVLMSLKTVTRNMVWKNDHTLFTTDVKTNPRSAKLLNAAGGTLTTTASKLAEGPKKTAMLNQAIGYLNEAIKVHPTYRNAFLLLGNAHYYNKNYEASIEKLDQVLKLYPDFRDAQKNLPIILRDAGKYYGQQQQNIAKSENLLLRSKQLDPNDQETIRLLGIVNGIKGDLPTALKYFQDVLAMDPDNASTYVNIGTTYQNMGDKAKAREYYDKAVAIDPQALNILVPKN